MITGRAAEFASVLPDGGRLLGLDIGSKTIGVASCDARWTIATPDKTIARRKFSADKAAIAALVAALDIKGLVIGLPLNLDGSESRRSQSTRAFAKNLADLSLPILLWDERWSTMAVERAMVAQDISRAKRAMRIDSAAAAYILEGAIAGLCGV